jgi:proline dehydrogenase
MKPNFNNTQIAYKHLSNGELRRALFLFTFITKPVFVSIGKTLLQIAKILRIPYGWIVKNNIFKHFCAGTSVDKCDKTIIKLGDHGCYSILDYSAEGLEGEENFDKVRDEILKTIEIAKNQPYISFGVFKFTGLCSFSLLEKVSSGAPLSESEQQYWLAAKKRAESIYEKAAIHGLSIFVDAEDSWIQPAIDEMVFEMMPRFNKEKPIVYTTIQMYRIEGISMLQRLIQYAQDQQCKAGVKLVRGAYMENERERAFEMKYPTPIHFTKQDTDNAYNEAVATCISNIDTIHVCVATHNEESCMNTLELMEKHHLEPCDKRVAFAQLYGMSDHITFNLANSGYFVSKYLPYGPVQKVMPYLVRRAEENSSVAAQSNREIQNFKRELTRRIQLR